MNDGDVPISIGQRPYQRDVTSSRITVYGMEETHDAPAAASADKERLTIRERITITLTFFSMFFGAANLIFPPFLGAQAGSSTPVAAIGFIVSAVGLPVLGVLAVSSAGGFEYLANRVSPRFAIFLALAIILTIGPCFAIPRTATTSFEMAVVPFTASIPLWLTRLIYSAVFFLLSFFLAQRPEILSRTLGRFMGPLLLAMIVVLFVACLIVPHGTFPEANGNYAQSQLSQGFLDGYQTMDLLAALYFGIVISANVKQMGVTGVSGNRRETGYAGLGTGVLLIIIYGALAFIGMVSGAITPVNPVTDTGATVLTNLSASAFGPAGTAFMGVIFIVACFNVCTGLISTCGTFFHDHFPSVANHPVSYRTWSAIFAAFSFLVSNAGLNAIIAVSVPVLSALYPIAIVLVVLSLLHGVFSSKFPRVYFWSVLFAGIVSIINCCSSLLTLAGVSLPWLNAVCDVIPLNDIHVGWLLPAVLGVIVGVIDDRMADHQ